MTFDEILSYFHGVIRGTYPQHYARCPVHGDTKPSLSISIGYTGKVVLNCKVCGSGDELVERIVSAVGLTTDDLRLGQGSSPRPGSRGGSGVSAGASPSSSASWTRLERSERLPAAETSPDWEAMQWELVSQPHLSRVQATLAGRLGAGITAEAIASLRVAYQWSPERRTWTWPEVDGSGQIVGICTRDDREDQKRQVKGGHRGLVVPVGWEQSSGTVYLVEGMTDTAALASMGLSVVGRPGAKASHRVVDWLVDLLRDLDAGRPIVVIADRDDLTNPGKTAGRDGAVDLAEQLGERLGRRVRVAYPPAGCKDSRSWLNAHAESVDPLTLAFQYEAGLEYVASSREEDVEVEDLSAGRGEVDPGQGQPSPVSLSVEPGREESSNQSANSDVSQRLLLHGASSNRKPCDIDQSIIDTSTKVAQLLGIPKPPPGRACYRAASALLGPEPDLPDLALRMPCRSWRCPVCSRRLAFFRGWWYGSLLHQQSELHLCERALSDSAWKAVSRAIQRSHGRYVRVEPGTLLTTVPVPGSTPIATEDAVRRLGSAILGIEPPFVTPERWQPLTASRAWSPTSRQKKKKRTMIGLLATAKPEPITEALGRRGIDSRLTHTDQHCDSPDWQVGWQPQAQLDEDERRAFLDELIRAAGSLPLAPGQTVEEILSQLDDLFEQLLSAA